MSITVKEKGRLCHCQGLRLVVLIITGGVSIYADAVFDSIEHQGFWWVQCEHGGSVMMKRASAIIFMRMSSGFFGVVGTAFRWSHALAVAIVLVLLNFSIAMSCDTGLARSVGELIDAGNRC